MHRRTLTPALLAALALGACTDDKGPLLPMEEEVVTDPNSNQQVRPAFEPLDLASLVKEVGPPVEPITTLDLLPTTFSVSLLPGQTVTEAKTVTLPAAPPKGDVLFSMDLTGSMGGELSQMKVNAVNIMNAVAGVIPDVQFGAISYEDYPAAYTYCGYTGTYGSSSDQPYRKNHSVSNDRAGVATAIGSMVLGSGWDGPESYLRAFYETYSDPSIGWRGGAKRIVVNFGDAPPHDCTIGTGRDPGRDGIVGNGDDLFISTVFPGMAAANITLINLFSGGAGTYNNYWTDWAAQTPGGVNFLINSNGTFPGGVDPATAISNIIRAQVSKVNVLTLRVCSESAVYSAWLQGVTPASYAGVTLPASKPFSITLGPPAGTAPGLYTFDVCAVGDGAEFGRQRVNVTVLNPNRPPVANAGGPYAGPEGTPVAFNGSGSSDPDGDALTYEWTFGDGGTATEPSPSHVYADNGTYTVTLTVRDPAGLSSTVTTQAVITNVAPVVSVGPMTTVLTLDPSTGEGSFKDPGADSWTGTVAWGDGSSGSLTFSGGAFALSHAYANDGVYTVTVTVTDDDGGVGTVETTATVLNRAPTVDAGGDICQECDGQNKVTLIATAQDLDGTVVGYTWEIGGAVVGSGNPITLTLPTGMYEAKVTVTDDDGATASDVVAVKVQDTVAPALAFSLLETTLWSPNHKLVTVAKGVGATDVCDPSAVVAFNVTSNEPINSTGDGNTVPDWVVVKNADGTYDLQVRAERKGNGSDRIYFITVTATDASGNVTTATGQVRVPRDQGKMK